MKQALDWLCSLWPFGSRMIYPERRHGVRWLTLKNAARAAIVLIAAFFLLSIWSAFRPAHSGDSVLQGRAAPPDAPAVAREPYDVVREGSARSYPPSGVIGSDPAPAVPVVRPPAKPQESPLGKGKRIVISGGAEGVQLDVGERPAVPPPPPQ